MNDAGDRRRVQQAALRVGAVVGIGSAVVLAAETTPTSTAAATAAVPAAMGTAS